LIHFYKRGEQQLTMEILTVTTAALALFSALSFLIKPKLKRVHVEVEQMEMKVMGINIFPLIIFMFRIMPDGMRKQTVTKQNAPKPGASPRDKYDCTGESPYETEEVKPGKIWQVKYYTEVMSITKSGAKEKAKAFGMDPSNETFRRKCVKGAENFGEEAVKMVKKDLETLEYWFNKETITNEEVSDVCEFPSLNSFVVKLNSGSLLLYAPVKIREEVGFGAWLDSLGPVEWIVVASSAHTLFIQSVVTRYPSAKIIGAPSAEAKLNFINCLPRNKFDYDCTNGKDMDTVNTKLEKEGVKLFYVDGDVATDAIIAVVHDVALECDLIYGHHDGEGIFEMDKETFRQFKPEHWNERLFKFAYCSKPNSPNGVVGNYRYMMMDPGSLGAMWYTKPASDGSSCTLMAESLRKLLKLEFDFAVGVHINKQAKEEFKKNIDANWNWLDGNTLM